MFQAAGIKVFRAPAGTVEDVVREIAGELMGEDPAVKEDYN